MQGSVALLIELGCTWRDASFVVCFGLLHKDHDAPALHVVPSAVGHRCGSKMLLINSNDAEGSD
jgi:hypothetical protein